MEKIFVFGRGQYFKNKADIFFSDFQVVGFIDNAVKDKAVDEFYHIPVYNPSKLINLKKYPIYCVATDFFGMWKQLKKLGIEDDRIRFGAMIGPKQPGLEMLAFSDGEILRSNGTELLYITKTDEYRINSIEEFRDKLRTIVREKETDVEVVAGLKRVPVSRTFGSERGKAADRYYIEKFLNEHSSDIKGTVMEVANNLYTVKFGGEKVEKSIISHVRGWGENTVKVNFETGEGVVEDYVDCLICTQTLQYIFNLNEAFRNIYKILKPGGVALITVPGIKPLCEYDDNQWGEYWSFTVKSVNRLCESVCEKGDYDIKQYGNAKVAVAYLYGICFEDLSICDFEENDPQYPFLISVRLTKRR